MSDDELMELTLRAVHAARANSQAALRDVLAEVNREGVAFRFVLALVALFAAFADAVPGADEILASLTTSVQIDAAFGGEGGEPDERG